MRLQAILDYGWPYSTEAPLCAVNVHRVAAEGDSYLEALADYLRAQLPLAGEQASIAALDILYRRHTGGFGPLKRLVGALAQMEPADGIPETLNCNIDVFAYAFLQGAKNFDLLLPAPASINGNIIKKLDEWHRAILALERLERLGEPLPDKYKLIADAYLALRAIMTRPSARDERRVLATLLLCGPSSLEELTRELRLNYPLSERTVAVFEPEPLKLLERRNNRFSIRADALPLVLFCVRECMGLFPVEALSHLRES